MNKTVALIQARTSSSRLPGKVLMDIDDRPMLVRVFDRARQARTIDHVAVITSTHEDDDKIGNLCRVNGIPFFRGSLDDVLDRYYHAAVQFHATAVVRLTADCPLLDPEIIDKVVRTFHEGDFDYVANILECTYPDGLDTEVFHFETLTRAWREARLKSEREHVTAYIYKHPELFRLGNVKHEEDLSALRWTVDTPVDLEFVRAVYAHFHGASFTMDDIVRLTQSHPEIAALNAGQHRNRGYQQSLQEDGEII